MNTRSGARARGAPGGKKSAKKCLLFLRIPIMLIPTKIAKAIENVTIRWLVTVKLYGIIPSMLHTRMIIKVVKIKGKCLIP
jgi:hypothetical protein